MAQGNTSVSAEVGARRDSISLGELVSLFTRQWRWAVATFVIVALIAIMGLSSVKPQWEARATIRIGQVYDPLTSTVRSIEPLQDVLERMRVKSFLNDALKGKEASPEAAPQGTLLESPRFDLVPSTGLIRVTARGSSADEAKHVATALFERLGSEHRELARTVRSEAELLAEEYSEELASLREAQSNLRKAFSSASGPGADDGPMALATIVSAMERNARETRDIERQRFFLVRRNERQSTPTEMIGEVSSVRIASVSRSLVVLFGIVMGMAAGLVVALLRDYLVKARSQRRSI